MNLIEFKNVDFSYLVDEDMEETASDNDTKAVSVLENLNLNIEKGSFVAILGHNGSGKSTIAKLTNGILFAEKGEVLIGGQPIKNDDTIFDI